jgi:hypothetical protein
MFLYFRRSRAVFWDIKAFTDITEDSTASVVKTYDQRGSRVFLTLGPYEPDHTASRPRGHIPYSHGRWSLNVGHPYYDFCNIRDIT